MNINTDYTMLIKVAKEEHIDALQKKGHIYCNTIQFFRKIEDDGLRGDKDEGKTYIKQNNKVNVYIKNRLIATDNNVRIIYDDTNKFCNIFCLYGVTTNLNSFKRKTIEKLNFTEKSKKFGNFALLICNPKEFIKRIELKLDSLNKKYLINPVIYYNPNKYEGKLNPFYKNRKYEYQNEVRLWLPNDSEKTFEFFIGDISDITYKIPIIDIDKVEIEESFNKIDTNASS